MPSPPRQRVFSGTSWESVVGYCRAIRVGRHVFVSGTTAVDEQGAVVAPGDAESQTVYVLSKIEKALREAGASLRDVVRTRIFVTDIQEWESVGRAHGRFFSASPPTATLVEVAALIHPELAVEIEVDALVDEDAAV